MGIFGSKDNQPVTGADNSGAPMMGPAPMNDPGMPQPMPTPAPSPMTPPAASENYIMTPPPAVPTTPSFPVESSPPVISTPSVPAEPAAVLPSVQATPPTPSAPVIDPIAAMSAPNLQGPNEEDLSALKQKALQELSPLVNHLEQSAEERFQTTMMMLQATDDQSLIQVAYNTAQEITDEKARAQALLDVINEINYFTQQKS